MAKTSMNLFSSRAKDNYKLRKGLLKQLYPTIANPYTNGGKGRDKQNQILSDLAQSFSRYAGNQQTAFDNGAVRSNANSNTGSVLELQVDRAIAQVLGRAPGRGSDSFVSALNGAFPSQPGGGQITFTPSRSTVSLFTNSSNNGNSTPTDLALQLPARQATLYRQGSIIAADAIKVLASLQSFMPEAVSEQVEALRAQVRLEITALVDEFGRIEEPRPTRVIAYFDAMALHLTELGRRAFLDNPDLASTADDEGQIAGFNLLKSYRATLRSNWEAFSNADKSTKFYSLSERVERANTMLPIIATSNADFEAAMDSVDFSESDRRSMVSKFTVLDKYIMVGGADLPQPDLTVYDLTDWLDRFASFEGPNSLNESGQYGLDFVTDQSDRLFWVIAPIVGHIKTTKGAITSGQTTLEQVLSNERVGWSLNNLLDQLDGLADLAVPGINP